MTADEWLRHLLPLPRQIEISGARTCAPEAVAVQADGTDDPALSAAAEALRDALGVDAGGTTEVTVQLTLDLADLPGAAAVQDLPHPAQSYLITCPDAEHVVIAAPAPAGLSYGALTLAQLLRATRTDDAVDVPRLQVVDGPAFAERGLWNFPDAEAWIPWLAGLKLNYGKMADTRLETVRRDGPHRAVIDADLHRAAAARAFAYVPYVLHLNFLGDVGLFRAYPELAGVGDGALAGRYRAHKGGDQHRCPCASQPVLIDVLAQWLTSIAAQGAEEVSCWLSERPCQCGCPACTPVGQFLLETRAFLRAWERARGQHPDLRIRIFSSTTTSEQDAAILAELPAEVRFERACATAMERVRCEPRDRFANALLDDAAAGGRWIASYDVPLGAFGNVDTPEVKVPQFGATRVRHFLKQLHRRGYAGAYGMLAWATQARTVCGGAIHALAEYSWNPEGRDVGDFAVAWATREGRPDPDAVGAWAASICDIEFDVYDGDFPTGLTWGRAAAAFAARRAPRLGAGLLRHFREAGDFGRKAAACRRAGALVRDCPDLARHTEVVATYVDLLGALFHVGHAHAHADLTDGDDRQALAAAADALEAAAAANVEAITAWRAELGPEPWHHRVHDAIAATRDTARRIVDHVRQGCLY